MTMRKATVEEARRYFPMTGEGLLQKAIDLDMMHVDGDTFIMDDITGWFNLRFNALIDQMD